MAGGEGTGQDGPDYGGSYMMHKPVPVSREYARFAERSRAGWDFFEYVKVCLMQSLENSPREIFRRMGKRMRMVK